MRGILPGLPPPRYQRQEAHDGGRRHRRAREERGLRAGVLPDDAENDARGQRREADEAVHPSEGPATMPGFDEVGDERLLRAFREGVVERVDPDERDEGGRGRDEGEARVADGVERPRDEKNALAPEAVRESPAPRREGGLDRVRERPEDWQPGRGDPELLRLEEEERVRRRGKREQREYARGSPEEGRKRKIFLER